MSKESEFKFHSATVGSEKGMNAGFDLKTNQWQVTQDVEPYKQKIKLDRERQDYYGLNKKSGYRKMATIPDIVAIKILQEHNLDLHDPAFMKDSNNLKKLKKVLITEYPDLLVNT